MYVYALLAFLLWLLIEEYRIHVLLGVYLHVYTVSITNKQTLFPPYSHNFFTMSNICTFSLCTPCSVLVFKKITNKHCFSTHYSITVSTLQQCVPTNTPATPPAFPDTLAMFAQLNTSSPADASQGLLQEPPIVRCQQASNS